MSDISKFMGLTGIQAGHIEDALRDAGIDTSAVDWRTIGGDIKDSSDRYQAAWERLEKMYGITPNPEWRSYGEYKGQEIEFNAGNLKQELQIRNHGTYQKVMDALCYGIGEVPPEIEEDLIGYKGKDRRDFINVLCAGYTPSGGYSSGGYRSCITRMGDKVIMDRSCMKEQAERAGISGHDGSYAKCVTRNGDNVVIDRDCMRQAAACITNLYK